MTLNKLPHLSAESESKTVVREWSVALYAAVHRGPMGGGGEVPGLDTSACAGSLTHGGSRVMKLNPRKASDELTEVRNHSLSQHLLAPHASAPPCAHAGHPHLVAGREAADAF